MTDDGFIGIWVAVALAAVLGGAALTVLAATDAHVAAARARTAADASALAGMAASPIAGGAGDPAAAAQAAALANGAVLVDVDRRGWPFRLAVSVRVEPRAPLVRSVLAPGVTAEAAAAVRPGRIGPAPEAPVPRQHGRIPLKQRGRIEGPRARLAPLVRW